MRIDQMVSLAASVQASPGVYALLLGSGISRSAGVPTGWEVQLDLIRRVAAVRGEDPGPDPAVWYRERYAAEPDYSDLLDELGPAPGDRQALLSGYFEPTEDERERGLKLPTPAHRAIARLVAGRYVRVIVTTNFDRLLEVALADAGEVPTVVSTPDAVRGAIPLVHSTCTVVKLHGDYLDARIRNTRAELERYDPGFDALLDRIFDEFGLVVCGWSGDWDLALRAALERCSSHRFTTYWTTRDEPSDTAGRLAALRRAIVMPIEGADSFFTRLADGVAAVESVGGHDVLSTQTLVAILKRYLTDPAARIRLGDLVMRESEGAYAELASRDGPLEPPVQPGHVRARVEQYELEMDRLVRVMATGCFWAGATHRALWTRTLERIANRPYPEDEPRSCRSLHDYPALLLLYAGGVAAVGAGDYGTAVALLRDVKLRTERWDEPLVRFCHAPGVLRRDVAAAFLGDERSDAPLSAHLLTALELPLSELMADRGVLVRSFDMFEWLVGLAHLEIRKAVGAEPWVPVGAFGDRHKLFYEIGRSGIPEPALHAGLFADDEDAIQDAAAEVFVAGTSCLPDPEDGWTAPRLTVAVARAYAELPMSVASLDKAHYAAIVRRGAGYPTASQLFDRQDSERLLAAGRRRYVGTRFAFRHAPEVEDACEAVSRVARELARPGRRPSLQRFTSMCLGRLDYPSPEELGWALRAAQMTFDELAPRAAA
jgi:SIR2-like domain